MYDEIANWLDEILSQEMPSEIAAFHFNLYEDDDNEWSMELVGTKDFDLEDEDWACDEITDFDTRETPFSWEQDADWEKIFDEIITVLSEYLKKGTYANILKAYKGVGVGFVDGDIEILYSKKV